MIGHQLMTVARSTLIRHTRNAFKLPDALTYKDKKVYSERRKLGYKMDQMYAIAADVSKYSDFVPWCVDAKVVRRVSVSQMDVQLSVGFPPFVESYVSEVTLIKPRLVKSVCLESTLFHQLVSQWQFYEDKDDLPDRTCTLAFSVVFEFRSAIYSSLANVLFEKVTHEMVNAFMERAKSLYGQPTKRET